MSHSPLPLRVSDIPAQGRTTIESTASIVAADQALRASGHQVLAVVNNQRFLGTLSRADLDSLRRAHPDAASPVSAHTFTVERAMNMRVAVCDLSERADEALRRCRIVDAEYLLTVDRDSTLHGVIHRDDLHRAIEQVRASAGRHPVDSPRPRSPWSYPHDDKLSNSPR